MDPAETIKKFLLFLWQHDVDILVDNTIEFEESLEALLNEVKKAEEDREFLDAVEMAIIELAGELDFLRHLLKQWREKSEHRE